MSDESNLEPSTLDDRAADLAEGRLRGAHELGDVDPSLDEADRDVRIDATEGDDLPASPPDMQPRGSEREMAGMPGEETIDQRIAQEEPDPTSAYGAPDNESGLDGPADVGGDDVDAIPADQDFLGAPEGAADADADAGADDLGAEEGALHIERHDM